MIASHQLWLTVLLLPALLDFGGCAQKKGQESGSLVVSLEMPSQVRLGDLVPLKLKVKNTSNKSLQLTLGGRPAHDFIVTKPDGTEVWSWRHGQVVQQILQILTLLPGEELEFTAQWDQKDNDRKPVPAGSYRMRGVLHSEPPQKLETELKTLLISN